MDDDVELTTPPEGEMRQAGRQMTVAAIIITAFLMIGKLMGYIKEMLLAGYFGKSGATDAYKVVYNSVIFTIYTKIEKLLRPTYLPQFVRSREEEGEEAAWRVGSIITALQFVTLLMLAAICIVFAEPILGFVGKGLARNSEHLRLAVVMLRIMAPALLLFSLSVMPELTLHSYKRFTLPAVADASFRTAMVLVFVALLALVWNPTNPTAIYALAVGVVVGGCLRFIIQIPGLWSKLRMFRPSLRVRENKAVVTILSLMPPVVLGLVFSTFRTWADSRFGTDIGEGVYTCLDYARKLPDLFLQLLPLAVSFVVYPFLSDWARRGEHNKMADALVTMTRVMAFIFVPTTVALMVLSRPLVTLVYEHGAFGEEGVLLSSLALFCYAPGLLFFSLEGSINKWFFAYKDTGTPNYVGAACAVLHIVIGYVGVYVLHVGIAAIALALTISKSIKVIILYGLIRRRIGAIDVRKVLQFAGKLALATAIMGGAIWWLHTATSPGLAELELLAKHPKLPALASLVLGAVVGTCVFLAVAAIMRVEELGTVVDHLLAKVKKLRGR